jgi:hypothetical protein
MGHFMTTVGLIDRWAERGIRELDGSAIAPWCSTPPKLINFRVRTWNWEADRWAVAEQMTITWYAVAGKRPKLWVSHTVVGTDRELTPIVGGTDDVSTLGNASPAGVRTVRLCCAVDIDRCIQRQDRVL